MPLTLHYFGVPGRAEAARLLLTLGGVKYVDKRFTFAEWPSIKPGMPFHQAPVLELQDGRMLAQTAAIDRYCAAITGVLPSDPLVLADIDQAYFFLEEVVQPLPPVMALEQSPGATAEEKSKAYEELLQPDGPFKQRLGLLDKWLAKRWAAGSGQFLAGQLLSHADLALFSTLSALRSGWVPGLPRDILSAYPALAAFRSAVAAVPAVAAYYAKEGDEVRVTGFRPDTEAHAPA
eukprot:GHRQ01011064.1.p1 GENE.GHRQ01011064.1~~GHRQ01011064.1.p1  ORF type:complete len:234 (+),score=87.78 GHRQ01011064.1:251-952(+)